MTIAWVFPGQGSQVVGMGRDLYAHVPAARDVFDRADEVLDVSIARLCFEGPEQELTATENAQPALVTVSIALLKAIESFLPEGLVVQPQCVAGHSLGEYSALVAGGSVDFATAVQLVRRRGELMAASREGKMAAVIGLDEEKLDTICNEATERTSTPVVIANYNAPGQLVVSGATEGVDCACTLAKEQGAKRALPLNVSAAFHSPLMTNAKKGMAEAVAKAHMLDMTVPLIANVTGSLLHQADEIRRELVEQVVSPVRWVASVRCMVAQGISTFVEIGPGNVLTGLIKRIAPGVRLINVRSLDDVHTLVAELKSS